MAGRLAPFACILAVALCGLLSSLGLEAVLHPSPPWLVQHQLRNRPLMQGAGRRLADAVARGGPIGVTLGLSSMRDGVDPAQLGALTPERTRFVNLAGAGGSTHDLRYVAQPLLEHLRARPGGSPVREVVVGLHAEWLAETDPEVVLRRQRWIDPRSELERALWISRNAIAIATATRALLDRTRGAWMSLAGQPPAAIYGRSDAHAPIWESPAAPVSAAEMRIQLEQWTESGWFQPQRYGTEGPAARALRALLVELRDARVELRVVYMPCHSGWRALTPPEATRQMEQIVSEVLGPSRVLDLRAEIDDAHFADHSHLLASGRAALTRRLAAWLSGAER